jgi:hypothetical protein
MDPLPCSTPRIIAKMASAWRKAEAVSELEVADREPEIASDIPAKALSRRRLTVSTREADLRRAANPSIDWTRSWHCWPTRESSAKMRSRVGASSSIPPPTRSTSFAMKVTILSRPRSSSFASCATAWSSSVKRDSSMPSNPSGCISASRTRSPD